MLEEYEEEYSPAEQQIFERGLLRQPLFFHRQNLPNNAAILEIANFTRSTLTTTDGFMNNMSRTFRVHVVVQDPQIVVTLVIHETFSKVSDVKTNLVTKLSTQHGPQLRKFRPTRKSSRHGY